MGTNYCSHCECVWSGPEPSPNEFNSQELYEKAYNEWLSRWKATLAEHEKTHPTHAE